MKVKRRRTKAQNEALAYHEAGHVVAIWQLKGPEAVGYVTIEPDTFSEGHAHDKFCPDEKEFCKEGESDLYGRLSFELEKEKCDPKRGGVRGGRSADFAPNEIIISFNDVSPDAFSMNGSEIQCIYPELFSWFPPFANALIVGTFRCPTPQSG